MGAALVALPALEIAVRRGSATLAGRELVRVHRETHRASRLAPVESRRLEDLVEPFGLGLLLHETGARHDHGANIRADVLALRNLRNLAQVLDPAVGA